MRRGAVSDGTSESDPKFVAVRYHGACTNTDIAGLNPRHAAKAINDVAGKLLEEAILHHRFRTNPAFLGWLK
jgi:hypothetical protein